jgi:hypothetical protein
MITDLAIGVSANLVEGHGWDGHSAGGLESTGGKVTTSDNACGQGARYQVQLVH